MKGGFRGQSPPNFGAVILSPGSKNHPFSHVYSLSKANNTIPFEFRQYNRTEFVAKEIKKFEMKYLSEKEIHHIQFF